MSTQPLADPREPYRRRKHGDLPLVGDGVHAAPIRHLGWEPRLGGDVLHLDDRILPFHPTLTIEQAATRPGADCPKVHPVDDAVAKAIDELIEPQASRPTLSGIAFQRLAALRDRVGGDLFLVGGCVRDVLLGATSRDLDVAGTIPLGLVREELERLVRDYAGQLECSVGAPPLTGVQHLKVFGLSVLQYAALKSDFASSLQVWRYGSDLVHDCAYRDIYLNTLFYDVANRLVLDPSEQGLEDLGITVPHGEEVGRAATERAVQVRPIPLAPVEATTPPDWPLKGVARVVKSITKRYADHPSDPQGVWAWADDNAESACVHAAWQRWGNARLRAFMLPVAGTTNDLAHSLQDLYERARKVFPADWEELLKVALFQDNTPLPMAGPIDVEGLRELYEVDGRWRLGPPVDVGKPGPLARAALSVLVEEADLERVEVELPEGGSEPHMAWIGENGAFVASDR